MSPVRQPFAIVNELSLPEPAALPTLDRASDTLSEFSSTLRACRKVRSDLTLVSSTPLGAAAIAEGPMTFPEIAARLKGRSLEEWRSVARALNRAPFRSLRGLRLTDSDEEFVYQGQPAAGLGIAATNAQMAISLNGPRWPEPHLNITRRWLDEQIDGTLVISSSLVRTLHASSRTHVSQLETQIRELALPDPFTGADLWGDKSSLYPNLGFLPRVESQFARLGVGGSTVRTIHELLCEIDQACAVWKSTDAASPTWPSKVTPEAERRKRLCTFIDITGERRCFDLHARFTPGHGRIHFAVNDKRAEHSVTIAHVGSKLF